MKEFNSSLYLQKKDHHKQYNILGIDDAPFSQRQKRVFLIGVVMRKTMVEGVLSTIIMKDGTDATEKIITMITKAQPKIDAVFFDGIAFGGFNVISLQRVWKKVKKPCITIMRKRPNIRAMQKALLQLNMHKQLQWLKQAPPIVAWQGIFFQYLGCTEEEAKTLIKQNTFTSFIPESIRIAHLIGAGIRKGSSKGNA